MAQTAAVLDIMVRANTARGIAGLQKTNKELQKVDRQTKKTEGRVTAMSRAGNRSFSLLATGAKAGGLAIGVGLVAGLKKANDEAREAAKVSRQTAAVLKSTGGAAKVTTKEIESLANSIAVKSGMDDEAIQSAENLLLTFTKVRNETGKGNNIFSQATQTITDMSVALDQDLKSSTIQVGKALNDPIKGITALQRVGVSFTASQKEMVAGWVKSGDTLKAQRFILAELKTEFGGSAAAQADGMDRLKAAANNLLEVVGGPITAALSSAGNALATFATQMQTGAGAGGRFRSVVGGAFNSVRATIINFVNSLNVSKGDLQAFGQAASNIFRAVRAVAVAVWPGIKNVIGGQLKILTGLVKVFAGILTLDFRRAWNGVKQIFSGALQNLGGIIQAATGPLRAAASAAFGPIGRLATKVWGGIKSTISSMMRGAAKIFGDIMAGILRRFATLFDVAAKIPGIGSKFKGLADRAREAARDVDKVGESVKRVPSDKRVNVRVGVKWPKAVRDAFPAFAGGSGSGPPLSEAISSLTQRYAQSRVDKITPEALMGKLSPFTGPLGTAKGTLGKFEAIGHKFGLSTTSGYRPGDPGWHGKNRARDLSNGVNTPEMLRYARHMASKYGSKLLELIHTPLGFGISQGKRVPLSFWGAKTNAAHHNHVHVAAQKGAMVPGSGSGDKVRALLEPGEGIINKKAVRAMGGRGAIDALNSLVPRFQGGGVIGTFANQVRRSGLKGRKAAVIYEAMLRANAVEAGSLGANPRKGDRDSLGVFQIRAMHGPANKRMDPKWSANWFIRNARSMYRNGMSAAQLAALVERPAAQFRGRYGDPSFVPVTRIRKLVEQFQAGEGPGKKKLTKKQQKLLEDKRKGKAPAKNKPVQTWAQQMGITKGISGQIGLGKGIPFTPQRVPRGQETEGPGEAAAAAEDPRVALAEAIAAQAAAAKELKASLDANTAVANSTLGISNREITRYLADIFAGQLGTMAAQRMAGPSTGALARY